MNDADGVLSPCSLQWPVIMRSGVARINYSDLSVVPSIQPQSEQLKPRSENKLLKNQNNHLPEARLAVRVHQAKLYTVALVQQDVGKRIKSAETVHDIAACCGTCTMVDQLKTYIANLGLRFV